MRILLSADPEIPVPPREYGGIQRIVAQLALRLKSSGHTVGLIAHPASSLQTEDFFPWPVQESQGLSAVIQNTRCVKLACKSFQPDVFHSFSRLVYAVPSFLQKLPVLMSYQREPGRTQVALASALGKECLHFTGCSEYIARLGREHAAPDRWLSIYNFLEDDLYTPRIDSNTGGPLLFLSRLDRIKGAHTAIAVARQTNQQLVIAGNIPTTKEALHYFKQEIEPHCDGELIRYIGAVTDKQKQSILAEAKALLLPIEWNEPFGIVFIEALACGTPVITSPKGAAPEIVSDGSNGYLCSNHSEFCAAIRRVKSLSRAACYQSFRQQFTASVVCRQYEEAYNHCVKASL